MESKLYGKDECLRNHAANDRKTIETERFRVKKKSLRSLETILKVDCLFCTSSSRRRLAERLWCNRRVVVNAITDGLRLLFLSRWRFLPFLPPSIPRFSFSSFSFLAFTRRISRNLASRSTDIFRFAAWVNGNDHSSRNTSRPSLSYTRVNTRPTLHLDSLSSFFIKSPMGYRHGYGKR